ncbi:MAG: GcvT family protein [Gammaproteobacteria bacterium]
MTAALPARVSVVVIGGGVTGCSVLYHLSRLGADAVLLEKNTLSAGTTWHSAAQVRALRNTARMTEIVRYSRELYSRLEAETGQSAGWRNVGSLSVARTPGRLTHIRRQVAAAKSCGVRAEEIPPAEAKERWPLLNTDDIIGAVWSPDDGRAGPTDVCASLAKGAKNAGAKVYENIGVAEILTKNGKVAGVRAANGETIRCDAVAVCCGLWSPEMAKTAGAAAQLWPCEHFYLLTKPFAGAAECAAVLADQDSYLYLREESGGLLVGCFEPHARAADPSRFANFAFQLLPEDWEHFEPMMQNALHRVPALADAEIKTLVNGPESFTPDGAFLLGETAETPGLFLGCGMNSVGVACGGGTGRALAEMICGAPPSIPLPEADPRRFPRCWNSAAALAERAPETLGRAYEIACPGRTPRTVRNLRLPPLHEIWQKHNAHFGQTAGWERPLYFGKTGEPEATFARPSWFFQTAEEVRRAGAAAIFDLSFLGVISVHGADAESFLNRVCTNQMARPSGRIIYTLMLNEHGGIESDLTALRFGDEHYRLYTGAADVGRDLSHLRRLLREEERVQITDESGARARIGLFGEKARDISAVSELRGLRYFHHAETEIAGRPAHAARLSYIGEFGWEISCAPADAKTICAVLEESGATPAGLYAQDAMRIEKRFAAYHRELDSGVYPADAGMEFALDWDTPFVGRDAARSFQSGKKLVSIVLEDGQAFPCGEEPVYDGGRVCGRTTSAAFGHRVQKPVALAFLRRDSLSAKTVSVDVGGERFAGNIIDGAAFDPSGARMKSPE